MAPARSLPKSYVVSCGAYLPEKVLTNDDLAKMVDTSDEWITRRTGIKRRHILADDQTTADLALNAAKEALVRANMDAAEVDCIITATTTPDHVFPSVATQVQAGLGMEQGFAFDVQAACSGFLYAMTTADTLIAAGQIETCLIIGADALSRILDWKDRETCVLFGDGAGACVLQRNPGGKTAERGVIDSALFSDGRYKDVLYADGGAANPHNKDGRIRMQGKTVFRCGVENISAAIEAVLAKTGIKVEEIDWFVPHQANRRILDSVARRVGLAEEKIILTIEDHANTSAASVPLALAQAEKEGKIKPGHLVMLEAMGGGLTWGALILRW